ncbi:MAG: polysaccharide biosynthesis C-terminal domain-containing protein [Bacteroidia bacterium]
MLRSVIHSLFTKASVAVVNFLILIFTAKFLGLTIRGEISILILNISIIQMVSEIYTGFSLVHFFAKFNTIRTYFNGIYFAIITTLGVNIVLFAFNLYPTEYIWFLLTLSLVSILNTYNSVLILAKENFKLFNFLSITQPLLLLIGLFYSVFILENKSIYAFNWSLLFSFIVPFIVSSIYIFLNLFKTPGSKEYAWSPILKNGFYCQLSVLMYILSGKFSYYILENNSDVGLFSTSTSLIESILITTNAITPILLSKVANTSNHDKSINYTLIFAKLSFLFSLFAVMILVFIPNDFFVFILGNDFQANKDIMLLLSPGIIFLSFTGIISHYFSGIGDLKTVSIYNGLGFLINIILANILIPKYGIAGAATGTNLAYFVMFIASIVLFKKKTNITFQRVLGLRFSLKEIKELF